MRWSRRVFAEMRRLKTSGPTDRQVQDVKAGLLRDFETSSRQNAYLVGQLAQRYQSGEPPESVWQMPEMYQSLTTQMVHEAARIALDEANYVTSLSTSRAMTHDIDLTVYRSIDLFQVGARERHLAPSVCSYRGSDGAMRSSYAPT